MKKVSLLMLTVALLAMASCKSSPKTEERLSTIDGVLQDSVEAILERHLVKYGAMDGVAIVMETESGKIRAMVGLMAKSDSSYERGVVKEGFGKQAMSDKYAVAGQNGWNDISGDSRMLV